MWQKPSCPRNLEILWFLETVMDGNGSFHWQTPGVEDSAILGAQFANAWQTPAFNFF